MRSCNSLSTIHLNAILFGETPARFIWSFALTHGFSDISILSWQWCAFCHTSLDSVPFGSSYTMETGGIAPCFHWSLDWDSKGAGVNDVPGAHQSRAPARPQAGSPVRVTKTRRSHRKVRSFCFAFFRDSNPRALGKAPGAPCNPRWPAPQGRSSPRTRTTSEELCSVPFPRFV